MTGKPVLNQDSAERDTRDYLSQVPEEDTAVVPTVKVRLIKSVRVLPGQSTVAVVQVDKTAQEGNLWLVEFSAEELGYGIGIQIKDLLDSRSREQAEVKLANLSGLTQKLTVGTVLSAAQQVEMVEPLLACHKEARTLVRLVSGDIKARIEKLMRS